ncbi:hypothetical protein HMPREF9602_01175, partial [Cutibacterium acnes HL030PA2]
MTYVVRDDPTVVQMKDALAAAGGGPLIGGGGGGGGPPPAETAGENSMRK